MQNLPFIQWCLAHLNYWSVTCLMTIESCFLPFPSEAVIPPATYMVASGRSDMSFFGVAVCATIGVMLGAYINYFLALWLGRPIIYAFAKSRLGHLCLIDEKKLEKAEEYFCRHGMLATMVGRLVPAVRQLISIPAGLSRMNLVRFGLYTLAGATMWNAVLMGLGVWLAHIVPYEELSEAMDHYYLIIKWSMVAIGTLAVAYLIYIGVRYKK